MSTTTSRESNSAPVEGPFFLDAEHHRSQPTAPVPENAKGPAVPNEGYGGKRRPCCDPVA